MPWTIADLDGDGHADLAIVQEYVGTGGRSVLGLSPHDPSFSIVTSGPTRSPAAILIALDVDHDSDLDLVLIHPTSSSILQVWINDGAGRFEEGHADAWSIHIEVNPAWAWRSATRTVGNASAVALTTPLLLTYACLHERPASARIPAIAAEFTRGLFAERALDARGPPLRTYLLS